MTSAAGPARTPLCPSALSEELAPDGWRVQVLERCRSTNSVLAEQARAGAPTGLVVVAEEQTAGRGRLGRTWVSPARAGLTFSLLLRPQLPLERWPWLPLLAGVGVARTVRQQTGLSADLKWPNDVLVHGRKVCGLLAEGAAGSVVLGIGLNVTTTRAEMPDGRATSLLLEGATTTDRATLLRRLLTDVRDALDEADPEAYRALCRTVGQPVRLHLPDGTSVHGPAERVDDAGRLVVSGRPYAAGDVVHLREPHRQWLWA